MRGRRVEKSVYDDRRASDNDHAVIFRRVRTRSRSRSADTIKIRQSDGARLLYATILFALGCALGVGMEILALKHFP